MEEGTERRVDADAANPPGDASFRDSVSIVSREGKREWIYPKQPRGRFYVARTFLSSLLLAVLFGAPFISVKDQPLFLFNIVDRKFVFLGTVFGPHDFYLLALAVITVIVFIVLFTVVFGRLFCGWVCPQTVFMEMVFRRIDYWIEGDHAQQRRLNESRWTGQKILRKSVKYGIYFTLSFLISNMLLAWIIGVDALRVIITDPPSAHVAGLTAMLVFTGVFYWIFAWFREQACILVCPYGRLQGVLLDRNSIVIAYDHVRGEPRGKLRKGTERTEGDCIDCGVCVDVCPTGIDIRNGTQLECVNCTACMDACDDVMVKIGRPRGLIRYDSANGIATKTRRLLTSRVLGYSMVLVALVAILTGLLIARTEIDVAVLRAPGMFYQEQPDGRVSNVYDVAILNKTFEPVPVSLRLEDPPGEVRIIGDSLVVGPQARREAKVLVYFQRERLKTMSTLVTIAIRSGDRTIGTVSTTFLGPVAHQ